MLISLNSKTEPGFLMVDGLLVTTPKTIHSFRAWLKVWLAILVFLGMT